MCNAVFTPRRLSTNCRSGNMMEIEPGSIRPVRKAQVHHVTMSFAESRSLVISPSHFLMPVVHLTLSALGRHRHRPGRELPHSTNREAVSLPTLLNGYQKKPLQGVSKAGILTLGPECIWARAGLGRYHLCGVFF